MALGTPSESPAVVVKEIDLTGGVPNVQSTTGAIVGNFRWGPVEQRVKVDNEATLVDNFATPDSANTIRLPHSIVFPDDIQVHYRLSREVTSVAKNAVSSVGQTAAAGTPPAVTR